MRRSFFQEVTSQEWFAGHVAEVTESLNKSLERPSMPKWEYKAVDLEEERDFNALGLYGWELVAILYKPPGLVAKGGGIAFFKRPLSSKIAGSEER